MKYLKATSFQAQIFFFWTCNIENRPEPRSLAKDIVKRTELAPPAPPVLQQQDLESTTPKPRL